MTPAEINRILRDKHGCPRVDIDDESREPEQEILDHVASGAVWTWSDDDKLRDKYRYDRGVVARYRLELAGQIEQAIGGWRAT